MNVKNALGLALVPVLVCLGKLAVAPEQPSSARDPVANLVPGSCNIALIAHRGSVPEDAKITRLQEVIKSTSDTQATWEKLGWAYIEKARSSFDPGFYQLAEHSALCMRARFSDPPAARLLLGHVLHQTHRFTQAQAIAEGLVAQRGAWFDYGLLGDAVLEQGDLDAAVAAYEKMMALRPGPAVYSRAAHVRRLVGDLEGALEFMRMAVQAYGGSRAEPALWARVSLASLLLQRREIAQAERLLDTVLGLSAKFPPALHLKAGLLLYQGEYERALSLITAASKIIPLPAYQWLRYETLRQLQRAEQANYVLQDMKRRGEATDARTYALFLASMGLGPETSLRLAQAELAIRGDVHSYDVLAWAQFNAGRPAVAYRTLQQALRLHTNDPRLFYHAALISAAAGRRAEADTWCGRAAEQRHLLLPSERERLFQIACPDGDGSAKPGTDINPSRKNATAGIDGQNGKTSGGVVALTSAPMESEK